MKGARLRDSVASVAFCSVKYPGAEFFVHFFFLNQPLVKQCLNLFIRFILGYTLYVTSFKNMILVATL